MENPDQDKPEVIEARMLGGLQKALKTPPKPHKKDVTDDQTKGPNHR